MAPLSNAYPRPEEVHLGEKIYPLHVLFCERCLLVQLEVFATPQEIFSEYAYFSSYSASWLEHARTFTEDACRRLELGRDNFVVEVASNDGYLLQYFVERGIRVLGVDPAKNVAQHAIKRGVPTQTLFFGRKTAKALRESYGPANLIVANNVLAHVPDLHDFVAGFAELLAPGGRCSIEFPHLMRLMQHSQFDTIYHEHFSYLSLYSLEPVLARYGLRVVDVERLPTHGGSLRLWLAHQADQSCEHQHVQEVRDEEMRAGLCDRLAYAAFGPSVHRVKRDFLRFLIECQERGEPVAAYGAAAKGSTLLNYCGVKPDMLPYVVDRNPEKQGRLLPGSGIPIFSPDAVFERKPAYLLILPWNIKDEIVDQMKGVRSWGGRFVTVIPVVRVYD